MNELFIAAVERLSRVAGVRGALLVEGETGVTVISDLREGVNETAVAALAASLFRRTAAASETADFGRLNTLQLEADDGHVVAVDAGELILVVVAEHDAQLGLVRYEAHRAAESLS
ncbi:MAG: roadblock/LC7 domain-containing protein [Gemmatimonadetes bacterium]|nr:roadblock/LC7 domain-containing protein [Gemmatimonadota bacterium]